MNPWGSKERRVIVALCCVAPSLLLVLEDTQNCHPIPQQGEFAEPLESDFWKERVDVTEAGSQRHMSSPTFVKDMENEVKDEHQRGPFLTKRNTLLIEDVTLEA